MVSGLPVEMLQFGAYKTVLVALFCGGLVFVLCSLIVGCRLRWLARRRRLRRELKLRQQSKHHDCYEMDTSRCHLTVCDRPLTNPDESSKIEIDAVCGAPASNCAISSSHNVCHCLPRGLRRKSPSTAVIRRGRSVELLPVDRRSAELAETHRHSSSVAVLQRTASTGSRLDVIKVTAPDDDDSTSGMERWKPITVAGETMFPVQPSAAILLSFDVHDSV